MLSLSPQLQTIQPEVDVTRTVESHAAWTRIFISLSLFGTEHGHLSAPFQALCEGFNVKLDDTIDMYEV
jgi:hypothetical protein